MAFTLHPQKQAGEEVGRLLTILLVDAEHALGHFNADPAQAIHALRTAMKRVRAVVELARVELPSGPVERSLQLAREIKNFHGNTRDEEVLRRCCLRLCRSEDEVALVERWFCPEASNLREAAPELRALLRELRGILQVQPFWVVTPRGIRTAFGATVDRVKKGRRRSKKTGAPEDFHEWRKQVKMFWMQATVLRKVLPLPDRARQQSLKLGETLGEANDLANLCLRLSHITDQESAAAALCQRAEKCMRETHERALAQGAKLRDLLR
jgi:CHAD domain-containing protein